MLALLHRSCLHPLPLRSPPYAPARAALSKSSEALLDAYWQARGVLDEGQRRRLLDLVAGAPSASNPAAPLPQGAKPLAPEAPLPGVPSAWALEGASSSGSSGSSNAPEVLEVSRRLLQLHQLLGGSAPHGDDAAGPIASLLPSLGSGRPHAASPQDVVWMVVREPGLLTADMRRLTRHLLEMKVAVAGMGVDVLKVVVHQPALLLSEAWALDLAALQPREGGSEGSSSGSNSSTSSSSSSSSSSGSTGNGAGARPSQSTHQQQQQQPQQQPWGMQGGRADQGGGEGADPVREMLAAWEHGLRKDGLQEWGHRFKQLLAYIEHHGDSAVGTRDGDEPELTRWAGKQRKEHRRGDLHPARYQCLVGAGFEFDADQAEWHRWYKALGSFKQVYGHCSPWPLAQGVDLYLMNWCSVQRIARRSRALSEQRVQALDDLGFDWSGADPLS